MQNNVWLDIERVGERDFKDGNGSDLRYENFAADSERYFQPLRADRAETVKFLMLNFTDKYFILMFILTKFQQ